MIIKPAPDIPSSEITDERLYLRRREFIRAAAAPALAAVAGRPSPARHVAGQDELPNVRKGVVTTDEALTPWDKVTGYTNFYEFGTGKSDPARNARGFRARPWTVTIDGLVARPGDYHLEDLLAPHPLEERVYRLRCVEAWSMVIPWIGFPLRDLIARVEPRGGAAFLEFTTLHDPGRMPGQRLGVLRWPYAEGLRLDEAMHPLTLLAVGLYGKVLPNQNGAPLRLVVPWKYGFKSIKSIVRIRFTAKQPVSSWQAKAPAEYGFYANVNPGVAHPRWSQATEQRIGESARRATALFNGYGGRVAGLYAGMDLRTHY